MWRCVDLWYVVALLRRALEQIQPTAAIFTSENTKENMLSNSTRDIQKCELTD